MSKRKETSRKNKKKQSGSDNAKKPRTEGASVAVHLTDSSNCLDIALAHAKLSARIAVHTLRLVDAARAENGSHAHRMRVMIDVLLEDADRLDSLIDLSLVVEGEQVSSRITCGVQTL